MLNNEREKQITKTSFIGIITNVFLAGFKALVGFFANAVSVILDAVNNLTDAVSSVITVIGIKLSRKKPDKKHPYGYGRIEYFSAILVSAIVLLAGATALSESIKKIIEPEIPDYSAVTLIVIGVAVIAKLLLGAYVKKQGKKYNSEALVASGSDASFDAIISLTTLIGGAITMIFGFSVDGYVGAVISLFIVKAGIEMLLSSISRVMGNRPESEVSEGIREEIGKIEGVKGVYDLILHDYGPESAIGSVHVEVDSGLCADEIYSITRAVQFAAYEKFKIFLTVGIYPVDNKYSVEREKVESIAKLHDGVMGVHGFYVNQKEKYFSVDVLVDFTVKDRASLLKSLSEEMQTVFPEYVININFDSDYSD